MPEVHPPHTYMQHQLHGLVVTCFSTYALPPNEILYCIPPTHHTHGYRSHLEEYLIIYVLKTVFSFVLNPAVQHFHLISGRYV
jgi:hypothetical protein